jgi:hypothetical protein
MKSTGSGFMMEALLGFLDKELFTLTIETRAAVAAEFKDWLNQKARLKAVPDLAERLARLELRLDKLSKSLEVSVQRGKLVVKADAESEALLALLRRGSDWFEPHPSVNGAILKALVEGAK